MVHRCDACYYNFEDYVETGKMSRIQCKVNVAQYKM